MSYKATIEDQLRLEYEWRNKARDKMRRRIERAKAKEMSSSVGAGKKLIDNYASDFAVVIRDFIEESLRPKRGVQPLFIDLLKDFSKVYKNIDNLAVMASGSALNVLINKCFANGNNTYSNIAISIGREVLSEVNLQKYINENTKSDSHRLLKNLEFRSSYHYRRYFLEHAYKDNGFNSLKYGKKQLISLGGHLIELFTLSGLFEVDNVNNMTRVVPTQKLIELARNMEEDIIKRAIMYIPTIIKPKEWTGLYNGGYYGEMVAPMLRLKKYYKHTKLSKKYAKQLDEMELKEVKQALNKIQNTPYKVNTKVLDVLEQIIKAGGDIGGVPRFVPAPEPLNRLTEESTKEEIKAYKDKMLIYKRSEIIRRSHALRLLMLLEVVRNFKDYDVIYFPCNMDFRGRIYPLPMFNPQGDDISKALIEYVNPLPCESEDDFNLLCVQGANHAGIDKVSLDERLEWIKEHHNDILNVASDPFNNRFWVDTDEPFRFLAWAFEYKRAVDYKKEHNNSIIGFECKCIIAYDGTCSGLQHYSALMRDEVGGSAVNLINHDKPSDIYAIVAEKVEAICKEDSVNGSLDEVVTTTDGKVTYTKYGTKYLAQLWLTYGVTRKVTKRSVMTLAYGSGQYGFGEQVFEDTTSNEPLFNGVAKQASRYMAKLIYQSVSQVITSATEGMKWLKEMAGIIADEGYFVEWITPLGLPVQQQYMASKKEEYRLRIRGTNIRRYCYFLEDTPDVALKKDQVQGIAPNFIHSLDASHLMMTVNSLDLPHFTTVHDSFGTSLGGAKKLQKAIRTQFVKLYTDYDPFEEFRQFTAERMYIDINLLPLPPEKGNLDIDCVMNSTFVFH